MCSESESLLQSADLGFGGVVTSACVDLTSCGSVKRRQKKREEISLSGVPCQCGRD